VTVLNESEQTHDLVGDGFQYFSICGSLLTVSVKFKYLISKKCKSLFSHERQVISAVPQMHRSYGFHEQLKIILYTTIQPTH
jgi:hypothetical protein